MSNSESQGPMLKPYTVLLSDDQIARVRDLARREDRKQSAMLRRLLDYALESYGDDRSDRSAGDDLRTD